MLSASVLVGDGKRSTRMRIKLLVSGQNVEAPPRGSSGASAGFKECQLRNLFVMTAYGYKALRMDRLVES